MATNERWAWLEKARREHIHGLVNALGPKERDEWHYTWQLTARSSQLPPGGDWTLWLIMAGRGFGKTRAGAEWVRGVAEADPRARLALVGASLHEARSVMVEGESGVLSCCPPHLMPLYESSLRKLTWPNGAQATLFSALEPESLRGPQHSHAWCDEIAKWDNAAGRALATWDNLSLGLRLGDHPRVLATTTPRAVALLKRLIDETEVHDLALTRGRTEDNRHNLSARFLRTVRSRFGRSSARPKRNSRSTRHSR